MVIYHRRLKNIIIWEIIFFLKQYIYIYIYIYRTFERLVVYQLHHCSNPTYDERTEALRKDIINVERQTTRFIHYMKN